MNEIQNDWVICHHGILGQRWGVTNGPPYPLSDEVSTGKRLKNISSKLGDIYEARKRKRALEARVKKAQKTKAAKAKEEEKQKKAEEKEAKKAAKEKKFKDKIISKGNVKKALSNFDKFTTEELNEIIARGQLNEKLNQLKASNLKTGAEKLASITSSVEKVSSLATSGVKIYNVAAGIHNSMTDDPDDKWKFIKTEVPASEPKRQIKADIPDVEVTYRNGKMESRTTNVIKDNRWVKSVERDISTTESDEDKQRRTLKRGRLHT